MQATLLAWVFVMRILLVLTSVAAFYINKAICQSKYGNVDDLDFEKPLGSLVWITSLLSIAGTFAVSYWMLGPGSGVAPELQAIWAPLAAIISCGTLGAALIPEVTKIFTSPKSSHVNEVVLASRRVVLRSTSCLVWLRVTSAHLDWNGVRSPDVFCRCGQWLWFGRDYDLSFHICFRSGGFWNAGYGSGYHCCGQLWAGS